MKKLNWRKPMTERKKEAKTLKIETDFAGLIELLAKNLYPKEDMFIRELIQNAHDSIIARKSQGDGVAGRIDIVANRSDKTIIFRDNGYGMTEHEVVHDLATIGRSGTRELRKQLEHKDRESAQSLIGQFGIGVLSAFVVANRLELDTKKAEEKAEPVRWTIKGGPEYKLNAGNRTEPGTTMTVFLKNEYLGLTNAESLRGIARKYADFLQVPIYVNGEGPVNSIQAPWHKSYSSEKERHKAYRDWIDDRYPDIPLEVIPVDIDTPHKVQGALYISNRMVDHVHGAGMVDVYQARMFIAEGDRTVLPEWARFIRGVIDSPDFTPTAARDAIRQDHIHESIRKALGRVIIEALKRMAREEKERFNRLVTWHHRHIKGMAAQNDEFFDAVADTMVFRVNLEDPQNPRHGWRMITIPEYLSLQKDRDAEGRHVVYFISDPRAVMDFSALCEARGLIVLDLGWTHEEEFVERYVERIRNDIILQRVDIDDAPAIFQPLDSKERERYAVLEYHLQALLRKTNPFQNTVVRTERFVPDDIPAVLSQTRDAEALSRLKALAENPAAPEALSSFYKEHFELGVRMAPPVVLHLNVSCPLIDMLASEKFEDRAVEEAWLSIYNSAFLHTAQHLDVGSLRALRGQTVRVLEHLVNLRREKRIAEQRAASLAGAASESGSELQCRTGHVSIFVMMPFKGEEYDILEQALRSVLENEPYLFEVILARDRTIAQDIIENVKGHMRVVHSFIADVSDQNPNVMLELGMTQHDNEGRPTIILKRSGCPQIPIDLSGRIFIEYELQSASNPDRVQLLTDLFRQKFESEKVLRDLCDRRMSRFLSMTFLATLAGLRLGPDEVKKLTQAFTTVEELAEADETTIMKRAGLGPVPASIAKMIVQPSPTRF
jgi:molecular chaperone HtpG